MAVVEAGGYAPGGGAPAQEPVHGHLRDQEARVPARREGVRAARPQGGAHAHRARCSTGAARRCSRKRGRARARRAARTGARLGAGDPPRGRHPVPDLAAARVLRGRSARSAPRRASSSTRSVLGGTDEALPKGASISPSARSVPGGLPRRPADAGARRVRRARPTHPLHQLGRELTLDDLRQHRHARDPRLGRAARAAAAAGSTSGAGR